MRFDLGGSCLFITLLCTNDLVSNLIAAVLFGQHVPCHPHAASTQAEGSTVGERPEKGALFPLPATSIPLLQQDLELFRASETQHHTRSTMNPPPGTHACVHMLGPSSNLKPEGSPLQPKLQWCARLPAFRISSGVFRPLLSYVTHTFCSILVLILYIYMLAHEERI